MTKLYVGMDGTVTFDDSTGGLPVYEAASAEEASMIRVTLCSLERRPDPVTGGPWYKLTRFSGKVEDLAIVRGRMEMVHQRLTARQGVN